MRPGRGRKRSRSPPLRSRDLGCLAQDGQGVASSQNPFRLSTLDNVMEMEPNNRPEQATPFKAPAALNGVIGEAGDVDCFVFPAKKGQVFDVRVFARQLRTPLDSVLTIARLKGGAIASNDDSTGPDSYLRFTAPEDDRYVVSITDQMGRGGPEYVYRIEVTPVEPRLTMGLPERVSFVDVVVAVPRGNRTAVLVSGQREDFGGDVAVALQGLPRAWPCRRAPFRRTKTRSRSCSPRRPMPRLPRRWWTWSAATKKAREPSRAI